MDLLHAWSWLDWFRFSFSLLFFLGPGYALAAFVKRHTQLDRTAQAALALAGAVSFWPLLLAWLHLVGITMTPDRTGAVMALGWLVAFFFNRSRSTAAIPNADSKSQQNHPVTHVPTYLLWLVLLVSALVHLWVLRDVVVTPGSDGYHHTFFAQVMMERGGLPSDLLPLTSVASFTYHPGYHALVAGIGWLSGLSALALTAILGQVFKAGVALTAAYFALTILRNRIAALICVLVIGLIAIFPGFFVNWGRTTQLLGFAVLPVLLALLWQWCTTYPRAAWPVLPMALLAAGLVLIHYRVTMMAVIGAIVIVAAHGLWERWSWSQWGTLLLRLAGAGLLAGLLVLPWGWQVYSARFVGYAVDVGEQEAGVFTLARLGYAVLNYPTNLPLLILLVLAVAWALWRRERTVLVLTLWSALLYWLSGPRYLNIYMDTVTVFTCLYFPVSIAIGWFMAEVWARLQHRLAVLRVAVVLGLLVLALVGAQAISTILDPWASFVGKEDLPAMRWIAENTPEAAYFMVNTFHFDFAPNYIIGSDAGFWLPVLAQRRTVTAPMSYPIERNLRPDYVERIVALHQLGGDLTTPQALHLLAQEGVTHLYVGQRGGLINVAALQASPAFQLEYQQGAAYVFRFIGEK